MSAVTTEVRSAAQPPETPDAIPELSHREILEILSGLLVALLVTNMAGTVVGTALPTITGALKANEQQYMWVVTATLLASTASTPIWGKLADLFDKKRLIMVGLAIFIVGSILSGSATSPGFLIGSRAFQGIGLGAMMSLVQAIIGTIIPPRKRGRYMAYTGAVMAIATVGGPLVGGFLVDPHSLGWRWCFWSAVPFAIIAVIILQWRLKVPHFSHKNTKIDWTGAVLITAATTAVLIWISFVHKPYDWVSWQTFALLGFALVASVAFVIVELRVPNPIIPMNILTMRVTALAVLASIAVGVAMFGAAVFLSQYFQLGRGMSPMRAGLMTIPMMVGVLLSSLVIGRLVSKLGIWKPFVIAGSILLTIGSFLMSTIGANTSLVTIGIYGCITGLGVGMLMQNLVLAVQNSTPVRDVGAASGTVTFFRSLGGAVGIQALGFVFQDRMTAAVNSGIKDVVTKAIGKDATSPALAQTCATLAQGAQNGTVTTDALQQAVNTNVCPETAKVFLDISTLANSHGGTMDVRDFQSQDFFRPLVSNAIADSIGRLFLIAGFISILSIITVLFMKGTKLRTRFDEATPEGHSGVGEDED